MNNVTPDFLYKAFTDQKHADEFVNQGKLRLYEVEKYRTEENGSRGDINECKSFFRFSGVNGNPCKCEGTTVDTVYLFCTSSPKVDLDRLRKDLIEDGSYEYIVKIRNPFWLLEQLRNSKPTDSRVMLTGVCWLEKVDYDRGEVRQMNPDSSAATKLTFIQKSPEYIWQREYRYIVKGSFFNSKNDVQKETHPFIEYKIDKASEHLEKLY